VPWALEIDQAHRVAGFEQFATYHPTFLYELVWCLVGAGLLIVVERRFQLGRGKLMASYIVWYTLGRFWIEALRIDTVNTLGGFRLNSYTSAIVFAAGLALLIWLLRRRPGLSPEPIEGQVEADSEMAPEAGSETSEEPDTDTTN
jgi:prolipoprotein diacylglyceryltransferase